MFEALLDFEPDGSPPPGFTPEEEASPNEMLNAKVETADWLKTLGVDDERAATQAEAQTARDSFQALTTPLSEAQQREALSNLQTPPAVRHLVAMLTTYDWAFVEQAQQIRGYCVAQIMEEPKHPDVRVRLKALDMLGRVTEVGLFTEKHEVKHTVSVDTSALEAQIEEKLQRLRALEAPKEVVGDVIEAEIVVRPAPERIVPRETPGKEPAEPHPEGEEA